jgi:hypothetical protein
VTHGSGRSGGGVVDVEVASSSFLCVFFGVASIASNLIFFCFLSRTQMWLMMTFLQAL